MKHLVFERKDGGVSVASKEEWGSPEDVAEAQRKLRAFEHDFGPAMSVRILDAKPENKLFREAWRIAGTAVVVDMTVARVLKLAAIRRERNAKLDALDKEYMKALSTKQQDTKALEEKMQALRDIPQVVDLSVAKTPEELEAFEPAWPE